MPAESSAGCLFINGQCVGSVFGRTNSASWSYGEFKPNESFAPFAPLFGAWSLVMHAESDEERLSRDASDELRQIEAQLDGLQVKLHWPEEQRWVQVAAVNIDGSVIEWKVG